MAQERYAELHIGRCFADSLRVCIRNLVVLFCASALTVLLSAATGTLLLGSLYAGLMVMILNAMRGRSIHVGDVFCRVRRFPRFLAITLFVLVCTTLGLLFLIVPGVLFGVWCFYIYQLAADQNARLDEAFVESRKGVQRHGFWKHLLLVCSAAIFVGGGVQAANEIFEKDGLLLIWLVPVLLQPFGLGLLVSAYRQTLEVEAEQRELYDKAFEEMRDELQTAHDMQMDLLPKQSPDIPGYSLGGVCIPANNVGGDYYAYCWLDDEESRLALVVADVSGKAMEGAVTALRFSEMLRYEIRNRRDPAPILDGLNESLEGQIDTSTFITCCIAVLDVRTGSVAIANAGHCLPYHYVHGQARVSPVTLTGFPLGLPAVVRPDQEYDSVSVDLSPGDALVLYSDGVVEAHNGEGELYEEERFETVLNATIEDADADRVIRATVRDVDRFRGGAIRTDDVTLLVLKRDADQKIL